jgi:hypothetical protein
MTKRLLTGLLVLAAVACAQRRVDPRNTYHRVICVVPLVGAGTAADPRRPLYAPIANSASPDGIIAFTQVPTDDGKSVIVEFVARDRKAFQAILSDATVKSFEKGVQSGSAIETALKTFKRDFDLVKFEAVMP